MNQPREMRPVFGLYGDDIAFITDGDNSILKHLLICAVMENVIYLVLDAHLRGFKLPANPPEFHAGIFTHIAMFINDIVQVALQLA